MNTSPISPEFITENFPTLSRMAYLNNAATGIPPARTIEAIKQYLDDKVNVRRTFDDTLDAFRKIRENLAKLLGGAKDNYATMTSTSEGINTAAHAVEYPEGSNIVICDLEFPANYIPWQNVAQLYDVELRVAKSVKGAVPTQAFLDLIDENTRVVAVSLVQFATGYRTDIRTIADAIHNVNGILVVDIIQAAGWADIDLKELQVDFAAAQAAKWLIGPIGAGFIYVSRRALEIMQPRFLGWWGVKGITDYGFGERELLEDARRFQLGSLALIAHVGFLQSLETLLEISNKQRENTAIGLANYLKEHLDELAIDYYNFAPKNSSPIVSCAPPNVEKVHERLTKEKIICSVRNGRLRVSPHFYNTTDEIDRLVEVLRG